MNLSSNSISANQNLAVKYSCIGQGVMPDLCWTKCPENTKSFVLSIEDPDAPNGNFVHFLAINISNTINHLGEGRVNMVNGDMIVNDGGETDYVPACPPSGTHRYIFRIYALNTKQVDGISKDNFVAKIKPYILDQAKIITKFNK